jgi:MinD superfamily P-loop ATPase
MLVCPKGAITEKERQIGVIKKGEAQGVEIVYGELNVGEAMAVPLIRAVKNQMKADKNVVIDAPPGTACSLVASVHKTDYCILVTEPTPFGLHDLKITVQVLKDLKVPMGVVVNRAGLGDKKVYEYCKKEKIPLLLEIPFSKKIAQLYSRGVPFTSEMPEWKEKFRQVRDTIKR